MLIMLGEVRLTEGLKTYPWQLLFKIKFPNPIPLFGFVSIHLFILHKIAYILMAIVTVLALENNKSTSYNQYQIVRILR